MAPTDKPQTLQVWTAHCSLSRFRVRTPCNSSSKRPSHGFTGIGIALPFTIVRCGNPRSGKSAPILPSYNPPRPLEPKSQPLRPPRLTFPVHSGARNLRGPGRRQCRTRESTGSRFGGRKIEKQFRCLPQKRQAIASSGQALDHAEHIHLVPAFDDLPSLHDHE